MFGNYKRSFDDKNRIMIPSKLRDSLGSTFFITLGPDNVLEIRNEQHFNVWKDKLLSTNLLNKNARAFSRILLGNTIKANLDKQGRVAIPTNLLMKPCITKEATFVGVGNKVELWDSSTYEAFQQKFENEGSIDDLAEKLLKDGVEF
ncbi:MAG: division/cell wall cluster transcriptional repressor MraZ [Mycoplasmataceae bacterium]|nr:division/cell wall cluster transcriptional repressor MraZ [Mycoplasmataceae bacterium]